MKTNIDDGGPAFPVTQAVWDDGDFSGMTLRAYAAIKLRVPESGNDWLDDMIRKAKRDWFAGQALAGLLADPSCATKEQCLKYGVDPDSKTAQAQIYAIVAYAYSDAMLAVRKEKV